MSKELTDCPACGSSKEVVVNPDEWKITRECPFCGSLKCSSCDMGNDVECPACELELDVYEN